MCFNAPSPKPKTFISVVRVPLLHTAAQCVPLAICWSYVYSPQTRVCHSHVKNGERGMCVRASAHTTLTQNALVHHGY